MSGLRNIILSLVILFGISCAKKGQIKTEKLPAKTIKEILNGPFTYTGVYKNPVLEKVDYQKTALDFYYEEGRIVNSSKYKKVRDSLGVILDSLKLLEK